MIHHPVELAISFEAGTGVTRSVSREEVRFVTPVPCPSWGGAGTLRIPDASGGIVTVRVREDGGGWEVEGRFVEDLGFAAPGIA